MNLTPVDGIYQESLPQNPTLEEIQDFFAAIMAEVSPGPTYPEHLVIILDLDESVYTLGNGRYTTPYYEPGLSDFYDWLETEKINYSMVYQDCREIEEFRWLYWLSSFHEWQGAGAGVSLSRLGRSALGVFLRSTLGVKTSQLIYCFFAFTRLEYLPQTDIDIWDAAVEAYGIPTYIGAASLPPSDMDLTPRALPYAVNGVNYNGGEIVETGGAGLTGWSVVGGALPVGITIPSGILIGVPNDTPGDFDFDLKVEDESTPALNDTESFSLTLYDLLKIDEGGVETEPGDLTTRTDASHGIITLDDAGHNIIVPGVVDVRWGGTKYRNDMKVTAVNGALITVADGTGYDLPEPVPPAESTPVDVDFDVGYLPQATNGTPYSYALSAIGGTGVYAGGWSHPGYSFPGGLTMNANGVISGTPAAQPGVYCPRVRLEDTETPPQVAYKSLVLEVVDPE